jgi:hypothetical protein
MPTQYELFEQMTITLDHLVENAKKMKEELRQKSHENEHAGIESLQLKQHEILEQLGSLNKLLDASAPGAACDVLDECKARIRDRLGTFQVINQEFFDNISSQERVIDAKEPKKNNHQN